MLATMHAHTARTRNKQRATRHDVDVHVRRTHVARTDVFLHSTLYGTGAWDCGRSSGTGSDAGSAEELPGRQGVGVGEGEKEAVEDCEEGEEEEMSHRSLRAMAMDAAAIARREVIMVGGGVEVEAPGHARRAGTGREPLV